LWYKAPTVVPAGDQEEVERSSTSSWSPATEHGRNYRPKHVEVIEIVNKIITVLSS